MRWPLSLTVRFIWSPSRSTRISTRPSSRLNLIALCTRFQTPAACLVKSPDFTGVRIDRRDQRDASRQPRAGLCIVACSRLPIWTGANQPQVARHQPVHVQQIVDELGLYCALRVMTARASGSRESACRSRGSRAIRIAFMGVRSSWLSVANSSFSKLWRSASSFAAAPASAVPRARWPRASPP